MENARKLFKPLPNEFSANMKKNESNESDTMKNHKRIVKAG